MLETQLELITFPLPQSRGEKWRNEQRGRKFHHIPSSHYTEPLYIIRLIVSQICRPALAKITSAQVEIMLYSNFPIVFPKKQIQVRLKLVPTILLRAMYCISKAPNFT